jgi:hypothetical protein
MADKVYQEGIRCHAAPLERLERRFADFNLRFLKFVERRQSKPEIAQSKPIILLNVSLHCMLT